MSKLDSIAAEGFTDTAIEAAINTIEFSLPREQHRLLPARPLAHAARHVLLDLRQGPLPAPPVDQGPGALQGKLLLPLHRE